MDFDLSIDPNGIFDVLHQYSPVFAYALSWQASSRSMESNGAIFHVDDQVAGIPRLPYGLAPRILVLKLPISW